LSQPAPRGAVASGERIYLRRLRGADGPDFLDGVRRSRSLHGRWVSPPEDDEGFDAYVRRSRRPAHEVVVARRVIDDSMAGVFHLGEIVRGVFLNAYLGYFAFRPLAGKGYMREAMDLVLRHAFEGVGLHRVEANIQPGNRRSIDLVESSGFRREGFSPRYLFIAGAWRDHERWAITLEDWVVRDRRR
jgi:ribosomal-protein-alanine N-acetyltransferase